MKLPETRTLVACAIILLFAVAYLMDPKDNTMKGALIAAFAGAWGYYLGSSKGAAENRDALNAIASKVTQ